MIRRCALLLAGSLLAGCASVPPPALPARQQISDFSLEARFALRVTHPEQAPQSAGGRLSWTHQNGGDRVLLASPLGYGLAEIETTPTLSRLRTADGKTSESPDPDALIEEVTGQRLPVSQLPSWLLGRSGGDARIENDAYKRPARLVESGWQVDYSYADDLPGALPAGLTLSHGNAIELRLRIEEWRTQP